MTEASSVLNASFASRLWRNFILGGYMLSLGDGLALWAIGIALGVPVHWSFPVVISLLTLSGNWFNRLEEFEKDKVSNPERTAQNNKMIPWLPSLIILLLISAVGLSYIYGNVLGLVSIVVAYGAGILYTTHTKSLTKRWLGFKNAGIALPYALLVPALLLYHQAPFTAGFALVTLFFFVRIGLSGAFCDIKDVLSDSADGLKTFAVTFGAARTLRGLRIIGLLSSLPILVGVALGALTPIAIAFLVGLPYMHYVYWLAGRTETPSESLFMSWADAEFLTWLPAVALATVLLG